MVIWLPAESTTSAAIPSPLTGVLEASICPYRHDDVDIACIRPQPQTRRTRDGAAIDLDLDVADIVDLEGGAVRRAHRIADVAAARIADDPSSAVESERSQPGCAGIVENDRPVVD